MKGEVNKYDWDLLVLSLKTNNQAFTIETKEDGTKVLTALNCSAILKK